MRRTTSAVMALVFAAALPAQQGQPSKRSAADAEYEKLSAEVAAATAEYRAELQKVVQTDAYKEASKARDAAKMTELRKAVKPIDAAGFSARFMAAAARQKGDEAVPFLCWVGLNGDKESAPKAIDELLQKHLQSPRLVELAESLHMASGRLSKDKAQDVLARLQGDGPSAEVQAWALYWGSMMAARGKDASDADKAKAQELLARAEKIAPPGTLVADKIAGPRFQKEHLQIGMKAPEIIGEDMDGSPIKLSDYRGKVVVLDFWGFW